MNKLIAVILSQKNMYVHPSIHFQYLLIPKLYSLPKHDVFDLFGEIAGKLDYILLQKSTTASE